MDLDFPVLEVCRAFTAVFQGEPYDLDALRTGIRDRIEQLEAGAPEPSTWEEGVLRTTRQLLPIVDMIEAGEFEAARQALEFAGRW